MCLRSLILYNIIISHGSGKLKRESGAIGRGGAAELTRKDLGKVQGIRVSGGACDFGNVQAGVFQELLCAGQASVAQVGRRRAAEAFHKPAVEPAPADPYAGGDVVYGELVGVVVLDEFRGTGGDVGSLRRLRVRLN